MCKGVLIIVGPVGVRPRSHNASTFQLEPLAPPLGAAPEEVRPGLPGVRRKGL